jgi:cytochrome c oxidase cbb3-type subunit I
MTQAVVPRDEAPLDALVLFTFTGVAALLAILGTALSPDPAFRFHGWVMIAAFVTAFLVMAAGLAGGRFRADQTRYADGVIRAGVIATMFWAVAGLAAGGLIAAQLAWPTTFYFP